MNRPHLLWIKADPLHPLNTGGKIRTYNMMVELKKQYEITFFTLGSQPSSNEAELYSDHQHWVDWTDSKSNKLQFLMSFARNCFFSSLPFVIDRYTTDTITEELRKVLTSEQFDFVVCDFLSLSGNLTQLPRLSNAPHVVFQHNVESRIWERHTENASNFATGFVFKKQWQRYLKYEKQACEWFDGVIAVSEDDSKAFREEFGLTNVLGDVPTGVNVTQFQEFPRQPKPGSLVFLGSMDWMPNIDGICDFVEQTYPLIREKQPEASLTIVGRNLPDKVVNFAKSGSSITVTGTVDDVRP